MFNRFKKPTTKKKWQEDVEEGDNPIDILKEYKPTLNQDESNPPQNPIPQPTPNTPLHLSPPNPTPKKKQYQWMSDSDLEDPTPKNPNNPPSQTSLQKQKQELIKEQLKDDGYIDIFITKIPAKATEEDVVEYLTKFGKVKDIFMPLIEGTEVHKGKAFVQFVPKGEGVLRVEEHRIKGGVVSISNTIMFSQNKKEEGEEERQGRRRSRSRSRSRRRNRDIVEEESEERNLPWDEEQEEEEEEEEQDQANEDSEHEKQQQPDEESEQESN